jgi:hypothetical protein
MLEPEGRRRKQPRVIWASSEDAIDIGSLEQMVKNHYVVIILGSVLPFPSNNLIIQL